MGGLKNTVSASLQGLLLYFCSMYSAYVNFMTRHFQLIFETGIDRHFDSDIISDIKKILELRHEAIKDVHCLSQMKQLHQACSSAAHS